ncbi:glycosyl hydrolase, family 57 [Thioploca ingrica]|uniref:Glycosyl hydrolase, family 57 n=1 Tax=Thioploca ingrica TaxID=40754 RepID=A0A090BU96_9GAMM|nr:glycosyl hydrolase, family 57 [Thioploca ingrica]
MIFTNIKKIELPKTAKLGEGFTVVMVANGEVPFPQLIVRHADGWQWIVKEQQVTYKGKGRYQFHVPPEAYHAGTVYLQIEGCRVAELSAARPEDWIIVHRELPIVGTPPVEQPAPVPTPTITIGESLQPVIYFGIHKHLHQPYYNATDTDAWDGDKDSIFGQRASAYSRFIPAAVRQYIEGGLAHAGLSTSWSGSLIEQLHRCAETGRGQGAFGHWHHELRQLAEAKTALGNPRVDFTAFGFFHPLMALIPGRDIIGQIEWHRGIIRNTFGVESSDILFPPETAFHPQMIPALKQAGVNVVIYDSIHHFRACKDYPYAGATEGLLPPNLAEQENSAVHDWLQLHGVWAPSKISPQLLKPCLLYYVDHEGQRHEIIGVPAERYLGNEDARGGYGALQYEIVMGQIYDQICQTNTYDPKHPPFFILHSDGDNHGGGAESYYTNNTGRLVQMCQRDPRFQLITIKDYLSRFAVDPNNTVQVEPGAWSGADNGDPQFTKWFSWAEKDYSPDLNSWAVLTAFQNVVHSLEDAQQDSDFVNTLKRLLYTAETSCYWYWTGQSGWDAQVTQATNKGMSMAQPALDNLLKAKQDKTGPTIFVPWVRPANPGGKDWGQGGLVDAAPQATFRTFVYDISGIKRVTLHYYKVDGKTKKRVAMENKGTYPSQTNPAIIATPYQAVLPAGTGNIRYFIEAVDKRGNVSYSPVGRIYIA